MRAIRSVCVYCGSSDGADARFGEAAEELGRTLAADGVGLVYGGGGEGLMGRLARSTLAGGGYVTGIIPSFLIRKEHPLTAVQEMVVVENMHERKQAMFDRADAFIALPGGVGTLEELVEQLTWAQLNRHTKPILIADIGGYTDYMSTHRMSLAHVEVNTARMLDRVVDAAPGFELIEVPPAPLKARAALIQKAVDLPQ